MLHARGAPTHPLRPRSPRSATALASSRVSPGSLGLQALLTLLHPQHSTPEILPGAFPVASPSRMEFPGSSTVGLFPASPPSCLQAPAPSQVCPRVASLLSPGVAPRIRAGFILLCIEDLTPAPFPASLVPTRSFPSFSPSTRGGEAAPAGPVGKGTRSVFVQETENVAASSL